MAATSSNRPGDQTQTAAGRASELMAPSSRATSARSAGHFDKIATA